MPKRFHNTTHTVEMSITEKVASPREIFPNQKKTKTLLFSSVLSGKNSYKNTQFSKFIGRDDTVSQPFKQRKDVATPQPARDERNLCQRLQKNHLRQEFRRSVNLR